MFILGCLFSSLLHLFRKSTLLTKTDSCHDCEKDLCISDVTFVANGAVISVKHTKTIQFKERKLDIPIPAIKDTILCPVKAIISMLDKMKEFQEMLHYFLSPQGEVLVLTHYKFVTMLKSVLTSIDIAVII